jgi:hypothetical protein
MLCLIAITVPPAFPQDKGRFANAGLGEKEVLQFFNSFHDAIEKNDKQKVAAMIEYPVTVYSLGRRRIVKNDAAFIKDYDSIFDPKFREFIIKTKFDDLWSRDQGVATPGGEIWFGDVIPDRVHGEVHKIMIIAINGYTPKY